MVIFQKKPTITLKLSKRLQHFPKKLHAYVFKTLAELHQQGFSLNQSLQFMTLLLPKQAEYFSQMNQALYEGKSIDQAFACMCLSQDIQAQLFFGQKNGNLDRNLIRISQYLENLNKYKAEIIKVLIYPCLLFVCLIGMLFGIRTYILPQILEFVSVEYYEEDLLMRCLIQFFVYLPHIILSMCICVGGSWLGVYIYLNHLEPLHQYQFLVKWPAVKKWVKLYCSYRLAKEMGTLFQAGFSMQQILNLWLDFPIDSFLTMIAKELNDGFMKGESLSTQIDKLLIFQPELPVVIQHGELTSHVAEQCHQYAQRLYRDLLTDIQWKITFIQPILFIIIALLVLVLYLLLMLPMLTMEGL